MNVSIKKIIALFSAVLLATVFCGCGENGVEKTYTLVVVTEGGMPLEDVKIKVYSNSSLDDIVWIAESDEEGKTSFTAESSDKYNVVLENVPEGYVIEKCYSVTGEYTELSLKAQMIKNNELSDVSYDLGDVIRDFSITDVEGTQYQISELLKEKKAVVLNFWYINCGPCKMEFPYLQKAYEKYSKDIAVLAVNPCDGKNDTISDFADDMGLTFPMIKGESGWESAMNLNAYPTTVVIDRYGIIVMKHAGSITEDGVFEKIFEYFASDDYKQSIIKKVSDIK